MQRKMNWFGIAGGSSIFLLIAASLFVPWWQVTVGSVGKPFVDFGASPLNMNVSFLGQTFTFPLIMAINISVIISLLAGGITILILLEIFLGQVILVQLVCTSQNHHSVIQMK